MRDSKRYKPLGGIAFSLAFAGFVAGSGTVFAVRLGEYPGDLVWFFPLISVGMAALLTGTRWLLRGSRPLDHVERRWYRRLWLYAAPLGAVGGVIAGLFAEL